MLDSLTYFIRKAWGGVNKERVKYCNNLINELLAKGYHRLTYIFLLFNLFFLNTLIASFNAGLQPFVTLFYWDLPHTLEEEYGGFLKK